MKHPLRHPSVQLVSAGDRVFVKCGPKMVSVRGIDLSDIERVLEGADGTRTVAELVNRLPAGKTDAAVGDAIEELAPLLFADWETTGSGEGKRDTPPLPLAVLGHGPLFERVAADLSHTQRVIVERLHLDDDAAKDLSGARAMVASVLARNRLVVAVFEGVGYPTIMMVNAETVTNQTPCLFVTRTGGCVAVGPLVAAGHPACFVCRERHLLFGGAAEDDWLSILTGLRADAAGESDEPGNPQPRPPRPSRNSWASEAIVEHALRALRDPNKDQEPLSLMNHTLLMTSAGTSPSLQSLLPTLECPICDEGRRDTANNLPRVRRAALEVSIGEDLQASMRAGRAAQASNAYRTVGILGGGTAGYLAALALRICRPELEVTLIDSSSIPILGVGEATTPLLVNFLHSPRHLGLDVVDFYQRVRPTWKLGIRFDWGLPGAYDFQFPFQFGSIVEPMAYQGNIDSHCLAAVLQKNRTTPIFDNGDGTYTSLLDRLPFAYHLDNRRFVKYLQTEAARVGIHHIDALVSDAALTASGDIDHLVAHDGRRLTFDLFVDCSGFRSLLMGKKLASPFVSYASSLFNDSAVMADVAHDGTVKPYTLAETMNHGWAWNIPFEDSDHRGYVFSSDFCTPEAASRELRTKNPGMGETWSLRFRSGRHQDFFRRNVLALGNAYAFVEPLESTAIHMLIFELGLLLNNFPQSREDQATKAALTSRANAAWDQLRGFLAIHFRFNRKLNTPYWKECRARAVLGEAEARVNVFRERAPLMASGALFNASDPFFTSSRAGDFFSQEYVYDILLAGQQVPASYRLPDLKRGDWQRRRQRLEELARWSLPQAAALRLLRERPEMLAAAG